jgi:propionyl-CoA carboxylase beta chain
VEASELDLHAAYGRGVEEDAYEGYLNRSREKVDVFDVARGYTTQIVDEIIEPKDTRIKLIEALEVTRSRSEKLPRRAKMHGTPPT